MALNFTGRPPPGRAEPAPPRAPVFLLACLGLAAALGGLVFALAVRQPRAPTAARPKSPAPLMATLVGVSEPTGAVFYPPAPTPAAAPAPAPTPAPSPAPPTPVPAAPPPAAAPPPVGSAPSAAEIKARMLEALRRAPHGVIALSVEDDAGAEAYARQLAALFREAGWTVSVSSVFGSGPPMRGVSAALGSGQSDLAVRDAFAAAKFPLGPPPRTAGVIETPELFVGVP